MIKISFIIPIYNQEKYLTKCIESLINQTLTEFEVLLIDNNSTDNSAFICKNYAQNDSRIRYFCLEQRSVGLARNYGLKFARGKYISFVDSDDYINPNFAKSMYDTLQKNNSILCYCGIIKFTPIKNISHYFHAVDYVTASDFFKDHEISNPVWNKIFRKDIIDRYEIQFSDTISYVEDYSFVVLFYILGSEYGNIVSCPELLYNYRQHDNSTMAKIYNNLPARIKDLDSNVEYLLENLRKHTINSKTHPLIKSVIFDYYMIELPLWLIKVAVTDYNIDKLQIKKLLKTYQQLQNKYKSKFTFRGKIIKLLALFEIYFLMLKI